MSKRWAGLLIASVLLHVLLINWAGGHVGLPSWRSPSPLVMNAEFHALQPAPAAPEPPPQPKPKPRPRPAPPPSTPEPVEDTAVSPPADIVPQTDIAPAPNLAGIEAPGTSVESATEVIAPDTAAADGTGLADNTAAPAQEPAGVRYKVSLPPSASLEYDVQKNPREGNPMHGHGTISWRNDGGRYTVDGDAGVLIFTVLNFRSEGTIEENGIAPELYSEKRFRRAATNTHFHRERNTISFSASTHSYPRTGTEQDRASIIWQLAGIGRGDAGKFAPGAEIDIVVAGTRDAETWHIRVIGQEEITLGADRTTAWHVERAPRPGSYDQKLDIWLAPEQHWYPVKLRYTETNGDYLDMSLSKLNVSPVP